METLLVSRDDFGVVTVTLNRPEKKNAITNTMYVELHEVLDEVEESRTDRVFVLTGAGGDFCSGADLTPEPGAERATEGVGAAMRIMRRLGRIVLRIHELPMPTIASVPGVAIGAGCNLALGCDLIVASDRARFSEIFVQRGLSLDAGGSWLLPRLVGVHKAKELAYLGEILSAADAERLGIVNRVVPAAELDEHVQALARRIAALPPIQLSVIKKQIDHALTSSLAEALEHEALAQSVAFQSKDALEAMRAWRDKREPTFTGD
jgi:2-(1,2-epoxy-1,2-dihydrophenyl)acetyl-CoA isomerase